MGGFGSYIMCSSPSPPPLLEEHRPHPATAHRFTTVLAILSIICFSLGTLFEGIMQHARSHSLLPNYVPAPAAGLARQSDVASAAYPHSAAVLSPDSVSFEDGEAPVAEAPIVVSTPTIEAAEASFKNGYRLEMEPMPEVDDPVPFHLENTVSRCATLDRFAPMLWK